VAGHRRQPHTLREPGLQIRQERLDHGAPARRRHAEQGLLRERQEIRVLVGLPADHRAIHAGEFVAEGPEVPETAVEHDGEFREVPLQPMNVVVLQRRNLPVLLRRQAGEDRLPRVHDEHPAAGFGHRPHEAGEEFVVVVVVDADAGLDRHRHIHDLPHRRDAVAHQARLGHEARAEAARLHPVTRAADVEVDLVIAELRADARGFGQHRRVGATDLQRQGVFGCVESQQPLPVPVEDGLGRDHFRVEQSVGAQKAQKEPAMPVGPVHHGGDAERSVRGHRDSRVAWV